MPDYPTYVDVGQLDGETGFDVTGGPPNSLFGFAMASIGDVNGDGFDDFIISAPYANYGEGWQYVIFGTGAGFPSQLNVGALDGSNGFRVIGGGAYSYGRAVSAAGDFNGDGFGDFMVGHAGGYSTSVYVVFGRDSFGATLDLGQLGAAEGMVVTGPSAFSQAGDSLASGDFNGDGFVDLLIGATGANGDTSTAGAAYVVFGHAGGYPTSFSLAAIDGVNGFKLAGFLGFDLTGRTVASAGDVNHDGIDDILVGAPHRDVVDGSGIPNDAGYVYVVFGSRDPRPASVSLAQLDGTNGFALHTDAGGAAVGRAISSAGDFNGDGADDLLIGSAEGAWVVFGKAGGFGADIDLATLDGTNGFKVVSNSGVSLLGSAVSGGGDFNGDGFDDLIIGASGDNFGQGAAYLIFGGANGTFSTIDVAAMVPGLDTKFTGGPVMGYSVAFAGDINGDGFDDLLISYSDGGYGGVSVVLGRETSVRFTGGGGDDVRSGGSLEDNLSGGLGNDTLNGLAGADILNGDDGTDSLSGGEGDDALYGGTGADTLDGGDGADILDGGAGADALSGGIGDDIYYVDDSGDTVTELSGEGYDVVHATGSWTMAANIELLILDGSGDINGAGNAVANTITGNGGANTLDGGDGNDIINAGGGADSLIGGIGADQLYGEAGTDSLDGGDANDLLNGGAGADAMTGGLGDDTFVVDDAGDTTLEAGGQGRDVVQAGVSWTLAANIEVLTLTGSGDIGGTGNGLANVLNGNAGNNSLDGAAGDDQVMAGSGNDTVLGSAGADMLYGQDGNDSLDGGSEADLLYGGNGDDTLAGGSGNDILDGGVGVDSLDGGVGADQLKGGDDNDILSGGDDNDVLTGGLGDDAMTGGLGDDTFIVDSAGDTTVEASGQGRDVVRTSISWTLAANLEVLTLDGSGNINGTGNELANTLNGNAGNNSLDGADGADQIMAGAGNDTVLGGAGADLLYGQDGADNIDGGSEADRLDGGNGDDSLAGGSGNDILDGGVGVDSLDGGAGADQLNGGDGDDILSGGDDNDVLTGGLGADTMTGGLGDDYFVVDSLSDVTVEASGQGRDTVRASISWTLGANIEILNLEGSGDINGAGNELANSLNGNSGNNILDGGAGADIISAGLGNDTLIGGTGNDILTGGGGADSFVVLQASMFQSHAPAGRTLEVDSIGDFSTAQGDRLDLSTIDADSSTVADEAFHLVAGFTRHAGEMLLSFASGTTTLQLDVDGDGAADYMLRINGDVRADSGGWLL